jgi:hypothetical protein
MTRSLAHFRTLATAAETSGSRLYYTVILFYYLTRVANNTDFIVLYVSTDRQRAGANIIGPLLFFSRLSETGN